VTNKEFLQPTYEILEAIRKVVDGNEYLCKYGVHDGKRVVITEIAFTKISPGQVNALSFTCHPVGDPENYRDGYDANDFVYVDD